MKNNFLLLIFLCSIVSCAKINNIPALMPARISSYKHNAHQQRSIRKLFGNNLLKTTCNNPQQRIVLVGGCFDIIHGAHNEYLRKSRALGDYLLVVLEPDETIIKYKKRQPIFSQKQRAVNLASNRYVNEVLLLPVLNGYKDYLKLVQDICPNVYCSNKRRSTTGEYSKTSSYDRSRGY